MNPHILGVRHHSPACARRVGAAIQALRPRFVLIEGPADMNGRLDELALPHTLPVALFSYLDCPERRSASWTPFCRTSPEWVALQAAREVGAQARFMDLPAWSAGFGDLRNRYADRFHVTASGAPPDFVQDLCRRLHVDGMDALWDHLFEQPGVGDPELSDRLDVYFGGLRGLQEAGVDAAREAHMARCVAWAMARDEGPVVVVCGGWHGPALERTWREAEPTWPPDEPLPAGARTGTYLVPWSFRRLDSFTGYQSGMPSPAWYDALWEGGPQHASQTLVRRVIQRLRSKKQALSPADLIGAQVCARGLAALRGHVDPAGEPQPTRTDVLDGLAGALLKDAQDQPLPWSHRGTLRPGTDPILVEVVAAFSGDQVGRLAPGTPRPPPARRGGRPAPGP